MSLSVSLGVSTHLKLVGPRHWLVFKTVSSFNGYLQHVTSMSGFGRSASFTRLRQPGRPGLMMAHEQGQNRQLCLSSTIQCKHLTTNSKHTVQSLTFLGQPGLWHAPCLSSLSLPFSYKCVPPPNLHRRLYRL